jgi:hypothetical protein
VFDKSVSNSTDVPTPSSTIYIGRYYGSDSGWINGFLSNFHVVKGTALYTSNFTPPTGPISSVANTKLLCCKSNSSATAFDVSPGTITANGNAAATNFNPFTANINTQRGKQSGYATLNPLYSQGATFSDGNLKFSTSSIGKIFSTIGVTSGKWYWEAQNLSSNSLSSLVNGIGLITGKPTTYGGGDPGDYVWLTRSNTGSPSSAYNNGTSTGYGQIAVAQGAIVGIAFNADRGTLEFFVEGVSQGVAWNNIPVGSNYVYTPISGDPNSSTDTDGSINFGQKPFKFPPPAGFQPLALANTPRPTIVRPDQYVGITTYSGNDGTQSINTGFKPDFVWVKKRNASGNNFLADSVRGITKALLSDVTDPEYTNANYITSFNSNGFTVGSDSGYNATSSTYVAWAWKAGGNSNTYNINDVGYATASAAGLTAGSITPTGASVNTKSGFSIITYTGPNDTSAHSFSHGLGKKPSFIIIKNRDSGFNWDIYHSSLGYNSSLIFTSAATRSGAYSAEPDSALVNVQWNYTTYQNQRYVAYCWAEIPGFSKFGIYTGNASTDGPMIVTGFKPKLLIFKRTDTTLDWVIRDTERDKYNGTGYELYANLSNAEGGPYTSPPIVDWLSNGFKLRSNTATASNGSGPIIYMAFAETPTQNLYGAQSNAR